MECQIGENEAITLSEKVEAHMEAIESGKRFTDCAARKWRQMCIKTVTIAMAVAAIAQTEIAQWRPRVEAMDKYTEAEIMEVVSQAKEWVARVNQAVERVRKWADTKSDPTLVADMIKPMSQDIAGVVNGVRQFVIAVQVCQAKVEVIQAEMAVKEARENVDRVAAEASNAMKIEVMASKTRAGMSTGAQAKKEAREAKEKVIEKMEEAEKAKMVMHYVMEAAKREEFPLETAKETKEAMIEANRRWKIVIEQLHETWYKVIKTAVSVSAIFRTEANAWILQAERIVEHVAEEMVEIAVRTKVKVKEDFSRINQWVEGINKQSLQVNSLLDSSFTSLAEIAETVIQDTVKVITEMEKIIARIDGLQAKVETVQAIKIAEQAEADARKIEAEVMIAKIEYGVVVATKIRKEEVEERVAEKKKVARIVREEAEKKATAAKEAEAKERAKRIEIEMRITQKVATIVYVTNGDSNTVSVIDTAHHAVIATMKVGYRPIEIAVTFNGIRAYVTNYISNTVSVIDTVSHAVIATIKEVGGWPNGVAITPDGMKVYVTNWGSHTISVIDTASRTVVATVPVGKHPCRVAITPNGTEAYVTNGVSNTVSVVNTTSYAVIATILVGREPYGVAITPDSTKVYVTNSDSHIVSVINTANHTVIATILVGGKPYGVAIAPDGMKIYVTNGNSGTVSVIDTSKDAVTTTVPIGINPYEVVVAPNGTKVYVTDKSSDNVYIMDTVTHQFQKTIIPVGRGPHNLTIGEMPKASTRW
jgi:YVTN family beta-propeller protein